MCLSEFADIIEQYLGRGYTRINRSKPNQVSVKFVPKDKSHRGAILYSFVHPQRGEYASVNVILLDYDNQGIGHGKKGPSGELKSSKNALKIAQVISGQQLSEFLDDRKRGDDDGEISKIVSTADRLLKQGYRVDSKVIGAIGQVVKANFDINGFTPNGSLTIRYGKGTGMRARHAMRPFIADDDDKYEFELVGPKHYRIVDAGF